MWFFFHIIRAGAPTPFHIPVHEMEEGEKVEGKKFPFKSVMHNLHLSVTFVFLETELGPMATVSCIGRLRNLVSY